MSVAPLCENGCAGRCANSPGTGQPLVRGVAVSDRTCRVPGCERATREGRRMCRHHEYMLEKYGSLEAPERPPKPTSCSVDGCSRRPLAKGLCGAHYARQRKGLSLKAPVRSQMMTLEERFWLYVDTSAGATACWEWQGPRAVRRGGYGQLFAKGEHRLAHRFSWELANGRSVPPGLVVRHSCDNPPCVNPAHLSIGTQRDNVLDARRRDRMVAAKLTALDVLAIRRRRGDGESAAVIASDFDISPNYVRAIVRRESWRHVT